MRFAIAFGSFLVAALLASPTVAAAADKIDYQLTWLVDSTDYQAPKRSYKKLTQITKTRLLPTQLFVAASDILLQNGKTIAKAGTQFVALRSEVPVVCNVHKQNDKTVAGKKHLCLVDRDADGSFDSHFAKGRDSRYWYALAGTAKATKLAEIKPTSLVEEAPENLSGAPILSLNFGKFLDAGDLFLGQSETAAYFYYEIGSEKRMSLMYRMCGKKKTEPYGCVPAVFPSNAELLGVDLTLHDRDGEKALVSVEQGFEPAELYVESTTNGYVTTGELYLYDGN